MHIFLDESEYKENPNDFLFNPAKSWVSVDKRFSIENWLEVKKKKAKAAPSLSTAQLALCFVCSQFLIESFVKNEPISRRSFLKLIVKTRVAQLAAFVAANIFMLAGTHDEEGERAARSSSSVSGGSSTLSGEDGNGHLFRLYVSDLKRLAPENINRWGELQNLPPNSQRDDRPTLVQNRSQQSGTEYGLDNFPNLFSDLTARLNRAAPRSFPHLPRTREPFEHTYRTTLLGTRKTVNSQFAMIAKSGMDAAYSLRKLNQRRSISLQEKNDLRLALTVSKRLLKEDLPMIMAALDEIPYLSTDDYHTKRVKERAASRIQTSFGGGSEWRHNQNREWVRYDNKPRRDRRAIQIKTSTSQ